MATNRSIFRQKALEHYQTIQEPKTLPRFTSPLIIFWYWVLFFLLIGAVLSIWTLNVPVYEQGSGGIRNLTADELETYGLPVSGQSKQITAIMFFSEQSTAALHKGSSVSILITGVLQPMIGKVERIEVVTLTPDEARKRYQLGASVPSTLPHTSAVTFISFSSTAANEKYAGARATAKYQVGTVSVLPLLLKTVSLGGA